MGSVKFRFEQDPDTVMAFIRDPEVIKRRGTALGERNIQVVVDGNRVTTTRTVEAEIPAFAKKFLKPTNDVVEIKDWDPTTRTAKLDVDIKGAPTRVTGTIRIRPEGTGTSYEIDYQVSCSIPLVGKKIADYADDLTAKGMREEYEWNKRELDSRG
jgi:carbon monoxide dehydrogenase subunit G